MGTKKKKTICEYNSCTGCALCKNVCMKDAIEIVDSMDTMNAFINEEKCINCGLCMKMCPNNSNRSSAPPVFWKQGWSDDMRAHAASGGAASAMMKEFIAQGGFVASCLFKNGDFTFLLTNSTEEAKKFSGSKYVKSNPGFIYREVKDLLKQGKKVLFVGLPCQSAAIQNYCENHLEKLYTIDLICHGTPSIKLLKKFLEEFGIDWESIEDIQFRENDSFGLTVNGKKVFPCNAIDDYMLTFLDSVDYTENCYQCKYATLNRVSDITIGDAWGQLSDSVKEGVSLILCQSNKGVDLVRESSMHLEQVNLEEAVNANHQLKSASQKHPRRDVFWGIIKKRKSFREATFMAVPKKWLKQRIKILIIKLHLM